MELERKDPSLLDNTTLSSYEIDKSSLTLKEQLGEGSFGVVYKGLLHNNTPVAIKELKNGMTDDEVLVQIESGYRMEKPPQCPDAIYDIMLETWANKPNERPSFKELFTKIQNLNKSVYE